METNKLVLLIIILFKLLEYNSQMVYDFKSVKLYFSTAMLSIPRLLFCK